MTRGQTSKDVTNADYSVTFVQHVTSGQLQFIFSDVFVLGKATVKTMESLSWVKERRPPISLSNR